nr:cadherin-like beta sandwich domain-containing protein [Paenibacillus flagellatus]
MCFSSLPPAVHAASFTVDSARGKIAAGALHSVALKSDGSVVAWGNNSNGQCNVPSGLTGAVDVVAGNGHNLALKSDGTVAAWGYNGDGQSNVPSGLTGVKAIAAGTLHSLILKSDETVVAWGHNGYGQSNVPSGLTGVAAIAAGYFHSLALKSDGTVVAWGANEPSNVPSGLTGVVAIAAGDFHSLALKSDGTVVAWGDNLYGQSVVPSGLTGVVAIAAGYSHSLALKSDGTVVAWGYNSYGQSNVPAGLTGVVAIAAGSYHSLALKSDGTVVAWGYNNYGQSNVPAGLNLLTSVPVSNDASLAVIENTPASGTLSAADADGDPLTYSLVSQGSKGTVSIDNSITGDYTYTPNAGAAGVDTFTFKANDGTVDSNVATITVTITALSSNADLSSLTISQGTLSPAFAAGTIAYTASVANEVDSLDITPTVADSTATVKVNRASAASGIPKSVSLDVGDNEIVVEITAQNGTTKTYKVMVTRQSSNADLSGLTISSGTLSPAFAAGTTEYTASVANEVNSLDITPTVADSTATVKVNTADATSGSAKTVSLNVGDNEIAVEVTAQNGATKTYKVTVTRAQSSNADLSGLTISSGTLSPAFAAGTTEYSASVANEVNSLDITPTVADSTATVKVNTADASSGSPRSVSLNVGDNEIAVEVTAQNGATKTYKVTVTRAQSSNADLSGLTISSGTLSPAFAAGTTEYTASVANEVNSLDITPTVADSTATVKVNTADASSGSAKTVSLNVGDNEIAVEVTAQNGATKTYKVTVTRAQSSNADLSSLTISSGTLSPAFASGTTEYSASVANEVTSLDITPTVADSTATVKVNTSDASSGSPRSVSLDVGDNEIVVEVTAQNGATKTYKVTVTRAQSSNADLSSLTISSGTLSPAFAAGTTEYTASVANAVDSLDITPTVADHTASITVNGAPVVSGNASTPINLNVGSNNIMTVVVTAQNGATKTYTITVTRLELTDAEAVTEAKNALDVGYTAGDSSSAVTRNIVLPTAGLHGTIINWTSDKPDVIAADGAVTRPEYTSGDSIVVLTAVIAKNGAIDTKSFSLTVKATDKDETYTLTVENGTGSGSYTEGQLVTIKADTPPSGKEFDKWTGGNGGTFADANSSTTTFTMPAGAATVTATYKVMAPLTYGIGLSESGNHNFGFSTAGYAAQTPHTVTVSNTGTGVTGTLTVALSGTDAIAFTLSKTSISSIAASGSDSFSVVPNTGLAAGSYSATVTVSGGSVTSKSFTVSFTVMTIPSVPTNLSSVAGDRQVTLNWDAVTGADSYTIYQYEGTSAPADENGWVLVQASVTSATYTVTGLTNGTSYAFAVNAVGAGGTSGFSAATVSTPTVALPPAPSVPANLSSIAGDRQVTLNWDAVTGADSYTIYQYEGTSAPADENGWVLVQASVTSATYTVTGLTNGTSYAFAVKAVGTGGTSGFSEAATANPRASGSNGGSNDVGGGGGDGDSSHVTSLDGAITIPVGSSGEVSLDSEIVIHVPVGAAEQELRITIDKQFGKGTPLANKETFASQVFEVLKNVRGTFKKPVALSIKFDPTKVGNNRKAAIYYYDEEKKTWMEVGGTVDGEWITAEVDHFTKYAVLAIDVTIEEETPKQPDPSFTDIAAHWGEQSIVRAAAQKLVGGYPDGTFKPNNPVTRAEFTAMLAGALELSGTGAALHFTDQAKFGAWAKRAVALAVQAGIVSGYEDGSFRPDAQITRAEMASMIAKALKVSLDADAATSFADYEDIPKWAKGAVEAIRKLGIVSGRDDNRFVPNDTATRAEAVVMLLRMLEARDLQ